MWITLSLAADFVTILEKQSCYGNRSHGALWISEAVDVYLLKSIAVDNLY